MRDLPWVDAQGDELEAVVPWLWPWVSYPEVLLGHSTVKPGWSVLWRKSISEASFRFLISFLKAGIIGKQHVPSF